jgi:hypothetical protein
MRFTFIAACRFSLCPACRFGLTASSRAQPFGRESSNSTGGTSTRVEASFTGARRSLHFDICGQGTHCEGWHGRCGLSLKELFTT